MPLMTKHPGSQPRRIVIGVTGATGSVYAVRFLRHLKAMPDVETHLVVSPSGVLNLQYELGMGRRELFDLADHTYSFRDVGSALASGAFKTEGMVIMPCSMHTLASTAIGLSDNLITRTADVHLKERRRLILVVRETPLNLAHLKNMATVTEMGGIIYPPLPAFYQHPQSLDEMVDQTLVRIADLLGISLEGLPDYEWTGTQNTTAP